MRLAIVDLARSSLVYGSGQVLLRVISVLLLPIFTAYLSPADYGVVSVLTLATVFLGPVFAMSVPSAIGLIYFDEAEAAGRTRTVTTAVVLLAISSSLLVVAGAAAAPWLVGLLVPGTTGAAALAPMLVIVIATTALMNIAQPLLFQLQLEQRARTFVLLTVATSLSVIGLSLAFVVGLRAGVLGFVAAGLVGQAVGLLLTISVTLRGVPVRFDPSIARRLLTLGIPMIPSFLFLFVMFQANRYIIQVQRGLDELGVYTVGFNLGYVISLVVAGFQNAWVPFFLRYSDRRDEARALFGRIVTYYVLGAGALTLLFFLAARPGVFILTRPAFHDAYLVVGAAATSQFLVGLHSLLLAGVYFAKDVRSVPIIQGISAVVGLTLNVVLIPQLGIAGAGVALVVATFMMVVLLHGLNLWRRYLAVEYEWSRILPFGAAFIAIAIACSMPRDLPVPAEILLAVVGTLMVAGIVLRLLSTSERRLLLDFANRLVAWRAAPPPA